MMFMAKRRAGHMRIWMSAIALVALLPATLLADTVWVKTSGSKPLAFENVHIDKLEKVDKDEVLTFTFPNGRSTQKSFEQIVQIKSDDEPVLSAAEQAFVSNDMKAAADGYRKLLTSPKAWVKRRAQLRLAESATQSGDLASMVALFIQTASTDPQAAAKIRPSLQGASPDAITSAITQVRHAADTGNDAAKQVLLPFLAELYNSKKDTASAEKVLKELNKSSPTAANSADVERARADVALSAARDALSKKNYKGVIATLNTNASSFTSLTQQSDAMYMLAEARAGSAENENELKDAALAYMRVVANFRSAPDAPHVAESLFRTAQIEEKLKKPQDALTIYKQVAAEFKGSPSAQEAAQQVARLDKSEK